MGGETKRTSDSIKTYLTIGAFWNNYILIKKVHDIVVAEQSASHHRM
jgi:hypothetical protein